MKKSASFLLFMMLLLANSVFTQDRQLAQENTNAEKRIALVIGNGDYTSARKLANPANDATDMAKALSELGFEVISGVNLNLKQMNERVREFGDKLKASGGVGLFYYAGHGIQANNRNYLIPVEADISREDEIDFAALNFDLILRKMGSANNGLNIVILDACRNNPFARSWSRDASDGGLAQVNAPTGTFIAYATSPDKTASDGAGRNGLYTAELLKYIKQPNMKLEEVFKEVRKSVNQASGGKQIPWDSSSLSGDFYFKIGKTNTAVKPTKKENTEPTIIAKDKTAQERAAWDLVKNSSSPSDFRYFLEEFPNGANAANAKIRLDELVWQSVRGADKEKIQAYLNEFPNGTNAPAARIRLKQLEAASTSTITPNSSTTASLKAGAITKLTLPGGIEMSFAYIPAGEFQMGSTQSGDEEPVHGVRISQGFWMQQTEVTQAQWEAVMGTNPSYFKNCPQCPVENVSWQDVQQFITKLNAQSPGYNYRLPSEAEWEYAARAGTKGDYAENLEAMGWYYGNSENKTHKVATKQANGWNLYDMYGNVGEWVQDRYDPEYYSKSSVTDPPGSENGSNRVYRGGGWINPSSYLRPAYRYNQEASLREKYVGFRLLRR